MKESKSSGQDFVIGFHSGMEVLEHSDRDVNKVFIQKGLQDKRRQQIVRACKKEGVTFQELPKAKLDQLSDGGNHQGLVVAVAAYQYASLEDLFQRARDREEDPFFLILDGIEDPHNLGSILRTADAVGCHGLIIPERRAVGLTQTVAKTSTGAIEHVPVARVTNLSQCVRQLKEAGVWVFGTDMKGQNYWQMDATLPLALVIGNEGKGISPGLKKHLDGTLTIPMRGHVQSLNASVAAALLMYQVYAKRS
ncbi:23S rRNA (guanosine(2251)-2'-O)-methyltransferase RlmB [Aerococcus sp. UMB7834]|uniref:23S rRNA (guanosine(2251)-2'-O)-methyltransferase RlmB n=1 Tax=Aerococcus sp. UMB7834 TaxID=3046342 RepID=UPI002550652F|nr:23S rRNA (guanosine(2251)-2'-O)-methyltransferase RlmB [Aerococcus sp. UMB7834]MDK6805736.1 23S rRNA (guanosine(2251)-2'-O)-methyltransferase RlmB [Aerococcus sp. UMB7834]